MPLTALCQTLSIRGRFPTKLLLVMKLIIILTLGLSFSAAAKAYSQKITLSERNATLASVFRKIEAQTGYNIVYREEWINRSKRVNVQVVNGSLDQALVQCFQGLPLTYSIVGTTVVIKLKEISKETSQVLPQVIEQNITVSGVVTDESGNPIRSVSVVVPGTPLGSMTNEKGEYSITGVPEAAELLITYVGYEQQRIRVNGGSTINVVLQIRNFSFSFYFEALKLLKPHNRPFLKGISDL